VRGDSPCRDQPRQAAPSEKADVAARLLFVPAPKMTRLFPESAPNPEP